MYICFAEYKIMPGEIENYRMKVEELRKAEARSFQLYEGTDQPGLFVEIWHADNEEEAERVKEERLDERSPWSALSQWISGGTAKLHVWTFKPVLPKATLES
ncbi:hypothetical protein D3P08_10435 [Paenibacillus nanensis]|uniref:NIPSNAP domain-containing protein n=1 Tax=Paenibacillus nanensis TaxID=393251 RepID=A0A3A1UX07_9BACL|nr:hypothetical protein [Paenibacillus nanensis]RIX53057.1 hypothetical protein D3P08_10435 [Paenibacillus nanensis]